MSKELGIVVVDPLLTRDPGFGDSKRYAEKIAEFKLGKVKELIKKVETYKFTGYFYFADDGDTRVVKDAYDNELREVPIKEMIELLKSVMKTDDFIRYNSCLRMLEGFDDPQWCKAVVLCYEY